MILLFFSWVKKMIYISSVLLFTMFNVYQDQTLWNMSHSLYSFQLRQFIVLFSEWLISCGGKYFAVHRSKTSRQQMRHSQNSLCTSQNWLSSFIRDLLQSFFLALIFFFEHDHIWFSLVYLNIFSVMIFYQNLLACFE